MNLYYLLRRYHLYGAVHFVDFLILLWVLFDSIFFLAEHETNFFLFLRAISPIDLFALSFNIKSCIKQFSSSRLYHYLFIHLIS